MLGCRCLYVCVGGTCVQAFISVRVCVRAGDHTSNGGCRREEKSRKHWSPFTKLLSLVTANLFIC